MNRGWSGMWVVGEREGGGGDVSRQGGGEQITCYGGNLTKNSLSLS